MAPNNGLNRSGGAAQRSIGQRWPPFLPFITPFHTLAITPPPTLFPGVDNVATETLVKVLFGRFLLHLDLLHEIDDTACVAKIKQGSLQLKLSKKAEASWPTLTVEGLSKAELKVRRDAALKAKAERDEELAKSAAMRRIEDERKALKKQMALEEDERQHLDDLKAEEKKTAEADVYRALAEMEALPKSTGPAPVKPAPAPAAKAPKPLSSHPPHVDEDDDLDDASLVGEMLGQLPAIAPDKSAPLAGDNESDEASNDGSGPREPGEAEDDDYDIVEAAELEEDIEGAYTPDPRVGGVVKFSFTPRIFPTPMRESKTADEEDWIAKNRSHLRRNPTLAPALAGVWALAGALTVLHFLLFWGSSITVPARLEPCQVCPPTPLPSQDDCTAPFLCVLQPWTLKTATRHGSKERATTFTGPGITALL